MNYRTLIIVVFGVTILALLLKLFLFNKKGKDKEEFYYIPAKAFSEYVPPQECTPENNCFKGAYLRSQIYTNVCKGNCNAYNGLTREPVNINDNCFRMLGDYPNPNNAFQCQVNEHGQRNCQWTK